MPIEIILTDKNIKIRATDSEVTILCRRLHDGDSFKILVTLWDVRKNFKIGHQHLKLVINIRHRDRHRFSRGIVIYFQIVI